MQILRHSRISMTMEVYSEVSSTRTGNALKRLGRKLDGWGGCTFLLYRCQKVPVLRKPDAELGEVFTFRADLGI